MGLHAEQGFQLRNGYKVLGMTSRSLRHNKFTNLKDRKPIAKERKPFRTLNGILIETDI